MCSISDPSARLPATSLYTSAMEATACPHCAAPRPPALLECPRCGVIYAKAHPATSVPLRLEHLPPETPTWDGEADEAALEMRLRAWAVPAALFVSWLLVKTGAGHFLVRTFLSMWVHETGHATTAWLCGFLAFPGPWLTPTAAERSPLFALLISAALVAGCAYAWNCGRRGLATAAGALLAVQLCCTLLLRADTARTLIVFGGDAGCLVLGTLLMATMYAPAEGALRRGWLRWGFLVIGAASFADAFEQWWASRTDPDRIPFGMNEGVGLSDPSVLFETYHWSAGTIVHRYVVLGCACLLALAALYAWGLRRAHAEAR